MLPTLQLADLACRRGGKLLFEGVHLQVMPGNAVWLRGRNGSGKTSLLRLAAGLSTPERGQVLWDGKPVRGNAAYGSRLVYIAHANALKDDLTATEALAFLARVHGADASNAPVKAALEALGVAHRHRVPVRSLSQGQRRRVALARLALRPGPALWVLDEPFDALDDEGTQRVQALIARHQASGGSVLFSSHLPGSGEGLQPTAFDLDSAAGRRA